MTGRDATDASLGGGFCLEGTSVLDSGSIGVVLMVGLPDVQPLGPRNLAARVIRVGVGVTLIWWLWTVFWVGSGTGTGKVGTVGGWGC